jgi:hypothetical protein
LSSEEDVTSSVAAKFRAGGYLAAFLADAVGDGLADSPYDVLFHFERESVLRLLVDDPMTVHR